MKDYTLDTNIFIRFFINDIPDQFEVARKLFKQIEEGEATGTISILVINEIIWILEHYYEIKSDKYLPSFFKLLALKKMKTLEINKKLIFRVLTFMQTEKIDFTDAYLIQAAKNPIVSFDKHFQKLAKAS